MMVKHYVFNERGVEVVCSGSLLQQLWTCTRALTDKNRTKCLKELEMEYSYSHKMSLAVLVLKEKMLSAMLWVRSKNAPAIITYAICERQQNENLQDYNFNFTRASSNARLV